MSEPFDFDETDDECPNCHGEGYVSCCFEEFSCVDPDEGCDLCMRPCDWCRARPSPSSEE